jgi:PAS domain S-box-containing protein
MWGRLTIFQKGLLLVAVPAMIQLTLIWSLYRTQQHQVEAQHWATHTKEVLGQAQRILTLLVEEETGVRGFIITNEARFGAPLEQAAQELPAALEKLQSLVADNPVQSIKVSQIAAVAQELSRWYGDQAQEIRNGELEKAVARAKSGQANDQMAYLRRELAGFMQVEEGLDRQREATLQSIQQRLRRFLIAGTAVAFLGMVVLNFMFYRGISRRLAGLSGNAQRLAEGKQLNQRMPGGDEIALLDEAFHRSADAIAASQKALLQSEERLRVLVEGVVDYAIIMLDANGYVMSWNTGAERLKGYAAGEIIGRHFSCFYPADVVQRGWPPRELEIASAEGRVEDEAWRVRKDGSRFWANVVITAIRDRSGQLQGFSKVTRDLTERKQAEEAVHRMNEELELRVQARTAELAEANRDLMQKNQENEMFVYSVSHDLRSPLVSLQGFSKELALVGEELCALIKNPAIPEEVQTRASTLVTRDMQQSLKFIQSGVLRLSSIIDALLRLSRVGRVEYDFRRLKTDDIVARIIEAMSAELFEKGVQVHVRDLAPCYGDPTAIEQLFANLIGNALKYLAKDRSGEIEIGALTCDSDGDATESSNMQTYYVKDNGLGIPAAYHEKIFQAFQRVHPGHAAGEGMGLAIVRRVVQRHTGRIWVESVEGAGSTFFVALPARARDDDSNEDTEREAKRESNYEQRTNADLVGGRR